MSGAHDRRGVGDGRVQFGERIYDFQGVSFPLANSAADASASRLLTREAALLADAGTDPKVVHAKASLAKLFASEAAFICADRVIQVFGGRGYMRDNPAERYLRELRSTDRGGHERGSRRLIIARSLERRGLDRSSGERRGHGVRGRNTTSPARRPYGRSTCGRCSRRAPCVVARRHAPTSPTMRDNIAKVGSETRFLRDPRYEEIAAVRPTGPPPLPSPGHRRRRADPLRAASVVREAADAGVPAVIIPVAASWRAASRPQPCSARWRRSRARRASPSSGRLNGLIDLTRRGDLHRRPAVESRRGGTPRSPRPAASRTPLSMPAPDRLEQDHQLRLGGGARSLRPTSRPA